ncbi:MAG TPA: hypothetical protein VMF51_04425 [Nocardioides sp.]|jgi:hypothetical protein|nr:hypothetical protein [Nocardioides sp.]HTW14352.1 hypothetical protein [Nocardioides sp.]
MRDLGGYPLYVAFVDLLSREASTDPRWAERMQDGVWRLGVHGPTPDWS